MSQKASAVARDNTPIISVKSSLRPGVINRKMKVECFQKEDESQEDFT